MVWGVEGVPVPARRCSASQRLSGRAETLYRRRLEHWRALLRARFLDGPVIAADEVVRVQMVFAFDDPVVPDMLPYADVVLDALVKARRLVRSQVVSVEMARASLGDASPGVRVQVSDVTELLF